MSLNLTPQEVAGMDCLNEVIDITEAAYAKDAMVNLNEVIHIETPTATVQTLNESDEVTTDVTDQKPKTRKTRASVEEETEEA